MKIKSTILFIICFSGIVHANTIEIGAWVYPERSPIIKNEQFIFVDFWATWCGPCIKAMDHLAELKKTTGDKVVYIGLSNEPKELVQYFFTKRDPKTYIATDYNGVTFEKFNVTSLPYSLLIAPDGKIVWKGMPYDMSFELMKKLSSTKGNKPIPLKNKLITHKTEITKKETDKVKSFNSGHISSNYVASESQMAFYKSIDCLKSEYSGSLKDIAGDILNVPVDNIIIENDLPFYGYFTFDTCLTDKNRNTVIDLLQVSYEMDFETVRVEKEVYHLTIADSSTLWSNELYLWNVNSSPSFMSGEDFLQADNFTTSDLSLMLSNLTGKQFVYNGNLMSTHDWNLSFSSLDELLFILKDEYGIQIEIKQMPVDIFTFRKL